MGVVDLGKIRGTMWYAGKVLNGTSSAPVVFPDSGISYAYADDLYANTDNGNLYVCITPGAADVATWSYIGCIEGPQPPLVNNLTTNSTTMALTAKMGKTLDEKINNAGLYPYQIIPMLTEPSFLLRMEIEDKATEITVIGEEEEGTYSVEPLGISDRQTVTIPLNTAIGFSKFGDVIRNVKSSNASIFSYVLYDENTQEQCNINLKLWDSLLDQIDNIRRKGAFTEGEDLYLTAEVSQVLDGERKPLMPITHDAAVWHNKKAGITLHEKILSLVENLETLDAKHTAREEEIEEKADKAVEVAEQAKFDVDRLQKELIPYSVTIGDTIVTAYESYTTTTRITENSDGNTQIITNYANNDGYEEFSAQTIETIVEAEGGTVITKEVR